MKNFSDTIGNRTRDHPACSAVRQRTAPPAACPLIVSKPANKFPAICLTRYFANLHLVLDASLLLRSFSYYCSARLSVRTRTTPQKTLNRSIRIDRIRTNKCVRLYQSHNIKTHQQRTHSSTKLYFATVFSLTMGQ